MFQKRCVQVCFGGEKIPFGLNWWISRQTQNVRCNDQIHYFLLFTPIKAECGWISKKEPIDDNVLYFQILLTNFWALDTPSEYLFPSDLKCNHNKISVKPFNRTKHDDIQMKMKIKFEKN